MAVNGRQATKVSPTTPITPTKWTLATTLEALSRQVLRHADGEQLNDPIERLKILRLMQNLMAADLKSTPSKPIHVPYKPPDNGPPKRIRLHAPQDAQTLPTSLDRTVNPFVPGLELDPKSPASLTRLSNDQGAALEEAGNPVQNLAEAHEDIDNPVQNLEEAREDIDRPTIEVPDRPRKKRVKNAKNRKLTKAAQGGVLSSDLGKPACVLFDLGQRPGHVRCKP